MENKVVILVINTGSTSTKLAVYENTVEKVSKTLDHSVEELRQYPNVLDQIDFRKKAVVDFLTESGIRMADIDVIASRGGAFGLFESGAYLIDDSILALASSARPGFKPMGSWLAVHISYALARELGINAYFYDAVFTDELQPLARYSGISFIKRHGSGHPLNCREVCRRQAASLGRHAEDCTFIVCHLGGGISSELHAHGKIVDTLTFTEGAFTPERAGRVPNTDLIDLIYSGRFASQKELMKFMRGGGGLVDYLGTNSVVEALARADAGDKEAENVLEAMAYQVAKDIGALAAACCGKVDGILLTGGVANAKRITDWIAERVGFIAPVSVFPGSFEMEALAGGIYRVYRGEEACKVYKPEA